MNLLEEPWMPVRHHDGSRHWVAPPQLSDPRISGFDACRPDLNGALAQLAIGLLQSCNDARDAYDWRERLQMPPSAQELAAWFAPVREAFEFEGDGARFMQDLELREGEPTPIAALLIDTPGENAIRNNSDHFVKRGRLQAACPHCAALALFTLQLNAPAGEWLQQGVEPGLDALRCRFPWLAPLSAQQVEGGQTTPLQTHPDQVFWAMPRRIRLGTASEPAGPCDLCGRHSLRLIRHYLARNYGLNYKGAWRHPLSPYYEAKDGWLPLHPQPDGLGYRHWAAWVLGVALDKRRIEPARVVHGAWQRLGRQLRQPLRLWAFGLDMDNMKARCWYDSTVPLHHLADASPRRHEELRAEVGAWLAGAEQTARYLHGAVREACFGHEARGDLSHVDAAFWAATEPAFYRQLQQALVAAGEEAAEDAERQARHARAEVWLHVLCEAARHLFDDEIVGTARIDRQNPARVAAAHRRFSSQLEGSALRQLLGLPTPQANASKATKANAKRSAKAAAPTPE